MKRTTALVVALAIAGASIVGVVAATRTTALGASARKTSDTALAQRAQQLDAFEAALRTELAKRPPALPKVPAVATPAAAPVATAAPSAGGAQRIVYHRPPPIVLVKHAHRGDDGESGQHGGTGGDD